LLKVTWYALVAIAIEVALRSSNAIPADAETARCAGATTARIASPAAAAEVL
jgi:hypothetical protein